MNIVVKIGGASDVDTGTIAADIAQMVRAGHRVVVTHGGSADIERLARRLGVPQRQLVAPDGITSRYTDPATLQVVTLALSGEVAPRLVAAFAREGITAAGLSGLDGTILRARRKRAHRAIVDGRTVIVRDNHSGVVTDVNRSLLDALLDEGIVPVVGPPALAEDGQPVNVNADRAAAAIAAALGTTVFIMLTGAPGVLRDARDETSVMARCEVTPEGQSGPWAEGGMGIKLVAAAAALRGGVLSVRIADGRGEHAVRRALNGEGTQIALRATPGPADPQPSPVPEAEAVAL